MEKLDGTKTGRQRAEGSKVMRIKIDGLISKKIAEKVCGSFESILSILHVHPFYYEFVDDAHLSCAVIFFLKTTRVRILFTLFCR